MKKPTRKPSSRRTSRHKKSDDICAFCGEIIEGEAVFGMGRYWHDHHFTCAKCGIKIGHIAYFEKNGSPFCEKDFFALFGQKCSTCGELIKEDCVSALGKFFHPEHFQCKECGKQLKGEFSEKDGNAYCKEDFLKLFALKCTGCGKAITRQVLSALGGHWHPECFVCKDCKKPVQGTKFFVVRGSPVCANCIDKHKCDR